MNITLKTLDLYHNNTITHYVVTLLLHIILLNNIVLRIPKKRWSNIVSTIYFKPDFIDKQLEFNFLLAIRQILNPNSY